nr:hypothetical protein [uncultured bacterium]
MDNASASNNDVALVYIRLVRKESDDAADVLEQVLRHFGASAALRAALVLILLKHEIRHFHSPDEIDGYTHLIEEFPEVMPFLTEAINFCLKQWTLSENEQLDWDTWRRTLQADSDGVRAPFEDLLDQVRQHSPITAIKLEQIYRNYGIIAGGYAATTLVWIAARVEKFGDGILTDLTDERKLQEFSYFEFMREDDRAIQQFIDMIDSYRSERVPSNYAGYNTERDAMRDEAHLDGHDGKPSSAE